MPNLRKLTPKRVGQALAWRWRDLQPVLRAAAKWRGQSPRVYLHNVHPHPVFGTYLSHPTMTYAPYPVAELCHWVDMLPKESLLRKPHIVEVEHPLIFSENRHRPMADWFRIYEDNVAINEKIARPECRRVITFSAGLVEHTKQFVHRDLWHKLEFAYPAFPAQPEWERQTGQPFNLLVIASRFSDKGVPEAIEAFRRLRERHGRDVTMTLVSQDVPAGYPLPEGLTLHDMPRMDKEFKQRVYRAADVLLLPCYSETAACFTEACAYGVPIVTTRIHHGDEFVKDGVNGHLLHAPVFIYSQDYGTRWRTAEEFWADLNAMRERGDLEGVTEQIVDRIERMMNDSTEMQSMRDQARRMHRERFSPEVRNEKLSRLYLEALGR